MVWCVSLTHKLIRKCGGLNFAESCQSAGLLTSLVSSAITPDDKTTENNCREYWDGGSPKIQEFLDEHAEPCQQNWICRKLGLDNVLVQPKSPEKGKAKAHDSLRPDKAPASKKQKLSFLLQWLTQSLDQASMKIGIR
jgi:hypothetical protein